MTTCITSILSLKIPFLCSIKLNRDNLRDRSIINRVRICVCVHLCITEKHSASSLGTI